MENKLARLNWFHRIVTGSDIQMEDFNARLILQKAVYTAQALGMDFSKHDFGWYVRGPYSAELTVDGYGIANMRDKGHYSPSKEEAHIANIVKRMFSGEDKFYTAELVSSVAYAWTKRDMRTEREIADFVKAVKPWFEEPVILDAIRRYREARKEAGQA